MQAGSGGTGRTGFPFHGRVGFALVVLTGLMIAVGLQVAQAPTSREPAKPLRFDAGQTDEIERIVRHLLTTRPELLLEAQKALEARLEQEKEVRVQKVLQARSSEIYRRPGAPVLGNQNGDVTIVEFYDYNCPYCRRASAAVEEVLKADGKVRVVVQELPILSKGSEEAARVALAANLQGKYQQTHAAIAAGQGAITEISALRSVAQIGLDLERLRQDMTGSAVAAEIGAVKSLAQDLQIEGTPFFIVGDKIIPGAPEELAELLRSAIAETRANGCKACAP